MSSKETEKELLDKLNESNPGSIDGPAKYAEAYQLHQIVPERFSRIYGSSARGLRGRKGTQNVGIFAHEVSLFPEKGMPKDIAFDLKTAHDFTIERGEAVKVLTGVHLNMPDHVYASVRGRSGLSLKGIDVLAGVIDPQYRGEVGVTLTRTEHPYDTRYSRSDDGSIIADAHYNADELEFSKGDRIAQLIFFPSRVYIYPIYEIDKIPTTDRGEKGYGSTGNSSRET